jgi:competence protein ComEC
LIKRKGYSKIDTLVISHAHLDHSAGLEAFVDHLSPEHIVSGEPEKLLPGLKIDLCQAGEEWEWDGVRFEVLHPSLNEKAHWIENDASCVIRVSSGEVGVLLTGDIESASETYLTEHYADRLQSDVLVVPHHGSRTSSTPLFTQMVAPRHAIISAGYANRYRHPSPQTVKRYQENEVCVWNTALDGQVSLRVSQKGAENLRLSRLHKGRLWTLRRKQVDIGCL